MKRNKNKVDYSKITSKQISLELKREKKKSRYRSILKSIIYSTVVVIAFSAIIATLVMPIFKITGTSMKPTINDKDIVVSLKTTNLKRGDIIIFYHGNKILTRRVIATAGEFVNIDKDGIIYVDNKKLDEKYIKKTFLGDGDITYPYQVPDSSLFVLGDNRENSVDSRNSELGTVSKNDVVGKVILRIWPLKKIKFLKQ